MLKTLNQSRVEKFGGGANEVMDWLCARGVERVRVEWTDLHGIARGKRVPVGGFADALAQGVPFAALLLAIDLQARWLRESRFGEEIGFGDFLARPDLASLRLLRHEPATALVMTNLHWPDGRPVEEDPRNVLAGVLARLAARGFAADAAPEFEFYYLDGAYQLVDTGANAYSMQKRWGFRDEEQALLDAVSAHVDYEACNYEYGPGQFEITVRHDEAMAIADAGHLFRATMKEAAIARGRAVTFMAKPFTDEAGSSCHIHLSLVRPDGANAFHDAADPLGISATCRHFIGGVLAHLQDLAAIYLPYPNSYKRLAPDSFAPTSVAWGIDNRVASVRVVNLVPANTRIELRVPGGDVNLYLVLAGLIAAGLDGLEKAIDPGPPGEGHLDYQDVERITDEWSKALDSFEASAWVPEALGRDFFDLYRRIKRMEHLRVKRRVVQEERDELIELI